MIEAATIEQARQALAGTDSQHVWMALAIAGFAMSALPAILALATSFTRILLVLNFLRQAIGAGDVPPDRILTALAFFITFYTMAPVTAAIGEKAVSPYVTGKLGAAEAISAAAAPLRNFMLAQTRPADLDLFSRMGGCRPKSPEEVPFTALIPAFVISELKTAFQIGIAIFLPFLVIDLVIATTITSLGLAGINPITLAVPFKLLLFVLADGWHLVVSSLVRSIRC